jgi:alcohol dehydrogenase
VRRWRVGDRVVVPFCCGCGTCDQCVTGNQQICDDYFQPGFTAWGAFAEYVAIPHADVNVVRLPDDLSFVAAASLGCRFITSFRAVVAQGRVAPGEWVAVHGCGGIGLSAIMIAHAMGANVVGVDINDDALALAQTIGAAHAVNGRSAADVAEAVRDLTGGGAHVSLDALGSHVTCRNSIQSLRKRGRHVQVGLMVADEADPPLPMGAVIAKELEIIGSHGMQAFAYRPILDMITAGSLDPLKLVTRRLTLAESADYLTHMNDFRHAGVAVIDQF